MVQLSASSCDFGVLKQGCSYRVTIQLEFSDAERRSGRSLVIEQPSADCAWCCLRDVAKLSGPRVRHQWLVDVFVHSNTPGMVLKDCIVFRFNKPAPALSASATMTKVASSDLRVPITGKVVAKQHFERQRSAATAGDRQASVVSNRFMPPIFKEPLILGGAVLEAEMNFSRTLLTVRDQFEVAGGGKKLPAFDVQTYSPRKPSGSSSRAGQGSHIRPSPRVMAASASARSSSPRARSAPAGKKPSPSTTAAGAGAGAAAPAEQSPWAAGAGNGQQPSQSQRSPSQTQNMLVLDHESSPGGDIVVHEQSEEELATVSAQGQRARSAGGVPAHDRSGYSTPSNMAVGHQSAASSAAVTWTLPPGQGTLAPTQVVHEVSRSGSGSTGAASPTSTDMASTARGGATSHANTTSSLEAVGFVQPSTPASALGISVDEVEKLIELVNLLSTQVAQEREAKQAALDRVAALEAQIQSMQDHEPRESGVLLPPFT